MPGYGTEESDDGLLPWSWAEEHLVASRDYWVTSVRPDGSPHVMPVWGAWVDDALWFSTGGQSRKARNLDADPRCAIATEDGTEPVVIEGRVEVVTDAAQISRFAGIINDEVRRGDCRGRLLRPGGQPARTGWHPSARSGWSSRTSRPHPPAGCSSSARTSSSDVGAKSRYHEPTDVNVPGRESTTMSS